MTHLARCALLAAFFLTFSGEPSLGNVGVAVVLGAVAAWVWARAAGRAREGERTGPRGILFAPWLVAGFVGLLVRGALTTLRAFAKGGRATKTRVVEVPRGERTDDGIAVAGLLGSASPGSILAEVSDDAMRYDELAASEERAREQHDRFYERYQRKVRP